ncbi:MAG: NADH-quinone oxidoreductase subunit A [Deltaproteobacteria bacterium]|nr:NADH-quinone oxidoreductase subunit A [Deltaproteobacteria bacterium]
MLISDYLGVLVLFFLGLLVGVGALAAARFLGASRFYPNKNSPYECGIPSEGAENQRFSVKFYLVAVSFILFDIEAVFLIPWAMTFHPLLEAKEGLYFLTVGFVFLFVLTLGLIYEWRKGLLDWNV